jgi:hypothetical protein
VEQTRKSKSVEFRREVAKTCGRKAVSVEARWSHRSMMALKGTEPREAPGSQPVKTCAKTLKPAEAYKRIANGRESGR